VVEPQIRVDPRDPTPPYEQVRRQVRDLVTSGVLRPGERLPPLRQLAGDLGLAVGTVARAYSELEAAGVLVSRRGGGTRVAEGVEVAPERVVESLAQRFLADAAALGVRPDQAVDAVRRAARAPVSTSPPKRSQNP
jgi:DNA-binding transcriptional regulator YhcF (GntR family)